MNGTVLGVVLVAAAAGVMLAGVWAWVFVRRRGGGFCEATGASVVLLGVLVTFGAGVGSQVAMRGGGLMVAEEQAIVPPLAPLPVQRTLPVRERWVGPVLLSREVEHVGVAALGGGRRVEMVWWEVPLVLAVSVVLTCAFAVIAVPMASLVYRYGIRCRPDRSTAPSP